MSLKQHYLWVGLVVAVIVGLGAWLLLAPRAAQAPSQAPANDNASTTLIDLGNGQYLAVTGSSTVTMEPVDDTIKPPALQPLVFAQTIDQATRGNLQSQYAEYAAVLKKAPTRVDQWLYVGVVYKDAGQYDAAVAAWSYAAKAGPDPIDYIAYGNLGDLYLNFLHDYAKAAAAYKEALKLKPQNTDYQAGLKAAESHL